MSLRTEVSDKLEELYRMVDAGFVENWDKIRVIENILYVPVENNEDALERKGELEVILGRDIEFPEFDNLLIKSEVIDVKKVRRRIEDFLRKKASEETIMKLARYVGVPRY